MVLETIFTPLEKLAWRWKHHKKDSGAMGTDRNKHCQELKENSYSLTKAWIPPRFSKTEKIYFINYLR